jgi:hypothetical protein
MNMKRRTFLKTSTAASLALSAFPILGADSPTKKYRTALIGCGWWGNNILGEAMASGSCSIVALCDVDQRQIELTDSNTPVLHEVPKLHQPDDQNIKEMITGDPEAKKLLSRVYRGPWQYPA